MQEIIEAIQRGEDRQAELYYANYGLIHKIILKYLGMIQDQSCIDIEDLRQECFFPLVKAAQTYDPDSGKWSTWAYAQIEGTLKNVFRVLHEQPESLDIEINDHGDTLLDIVAEQPPDKREHSYQGYLQREIKRAFARADKEGIIRALKVVKRCDLDCMTSRETASEMGVSFQRVSQLRKKGLDFLSKDKRLRAIYKIDELEKEKEYSPTKTDEAAVHNINITRIDNRIVKELSRIPYSEREKALRERANITRWLAGE